MLKTLILGVVTLFTFNSTNTKESLNSSNEIVCRVTCTISVPDGFGGSVGFSGTAGNFLTSCESAREKACKRAFQNVMDALMDLN
jgi:hypothetical protein